MNEQTLSALGSILTTLRCILLVLIFILLSIPGKSTITEALEEAIKKMRGEK